MIFRWSDTTSPLVLATTSTYSLGSSHWDNHPFFDRKYIIHPYGSKFLDKKSRWIGIHHLHLPFKCFHFACHFCILDISMTPIFSVPPSPPLLVPHPKVECLCLSYRGGHQSFGKPSFARSRLKPYLVAHGQLPTLLQTNSSHLKLDHPKRTLVFQASIFRCELLVSGRVVSRG